MAAYRLGHHPLTLTSSGSSISKGETLADTARTIDAMGVQAIVVRCSESGGAALIQEATGGPVINAGEKQISAKMSFAELKKTGPIVILTPGHWDPPLPTQGFLRLLLGAASTDGPLPELPLTIPGMELVDANAPKAMEQDDPAAQEADLPGCCKVAQEAGRECDHPCCVEARAKGEICSKCAK